MGIVRASHDSCNNASGQRQAPAARILARQLVVKAARRMRREAHFAQWLTLSVDCLDAPRWTAAAPVAASNDDRAGLETLAGLWAALVEARPQVHSVSPDGVIRPV